MRIIFGIACLIAAMVYSVIDEATSFGLFILAIILFGLPWFQRIKAHWDAEQEAQRQRLHEQEQTQQAQEAEAERQQALERRAKEQRAAMSSQQAKFDEEAAAGRVRGAVSELLDYANMMGADTDNQEIVRAMHGTVNELAKQQAAIRPEHLQDDMLQFDIGLVLKQLSKAGLEEDLINDRIRKIFRLDAQPAPIASKANGSAHPSSSQPPAGSPAEARQDAPQERP